MRLRSLILPALVAGLLSGCGSTGGSVDSRYGVKPSPRVVHGGPVRKGGGRYQVGKPYKIAGQWFHPKEDPDYRGRGKASWYGDSFHGRLTANGEVFDMQGLSAAHPTLPLPSYVRVTNRANGHAVVVRVNDRGPFHGGRIIDVSRKAAQILGFRKAGIADVEVEYIDKARMDGEDDWLVTTATVRGERMSKRQLTSLGIDEKLLRRIGPIDRPTAIAARTVRSNVATMRPDQAPAPTATPNAAPMSATASLTAPAVWPVEPTRSAMASEPTDVLVGAFSDPDGVQYVAGVLGQFGEVELQPVTLGGQLLQHMTIRTTDPALARSALDTALKIGAHDARLVAR